MTAKFEPTISIIVATRNEERNIARLIKSVRNFDYPKNKIELIVVDNDSTDNTLKIVKESKVRYFQLKDELKSKKTVINFRGAQVNLGVNKSSGEIIFFPDADMTFDRNLLKEVAQLIPEKFDSLYVPEFVIGKGYFGKIRNFERSFYNATCIDATRFVRRDLFLKVGGFDVEKIVFAPDDWDLTKTFKKHGLRLGITKNQLYHHEEWLDLHTYLSKKEKYMNTFDGYIKKWGENDPDLIKQFGIKYRYFKVFIEKGKWKKILRHPVLSASMFFLRFMVGVKFLIYKIRG